MLQSIVKSYEELPLFLNAKKLSEVLGGSISSAYELMNEKDFPSIRIGKRLFRKKICVNGRKKKRKSEVIEWH